MERLAPEILRAYADALENKTRFENVEACRRVPDFDQSLLLALNRKGNESNVNDERVMELVRERLISVTVKAQEGNVEAQKSTVLGLFYTNYLPCYRKMHKLAVGVFPLYGEITKYTLRPQIESDMQSWERNGRIVLENPSAPQNDPFLVKNWNKDPDFIFFNKSPQDESYQTVLPMHTEYHLKEPALYEDALEKNVIERALWYTDKWMKPNLFLQKGFKEFIRENRHDSRYRALYEGYRKHVFPNTGWVEDNI